MKRSQLLSILLGALICAVALFIFGFAALLDLDQIEASPDAQISLQPEASETFEVLAPTEEESFTPSPTDRATDEASGGAGGSDNQDEGGDEGEPPPGPVIEVPDGDGVVIYRGWQSIFRDIFLAILFFVFGWIVPVPAPIIRWFRTSPLMTVAESTYTAIPESEREKIDKRMDTYEESQTEILEFIRDLRDGVETSTPVFPSGKSQSLTGRVIDPDNPSGLPLG
jgi:hypothetical protein